MRNFLFDKPWFKKYEEKISEEDWKKFVKAIKNLTIDDVYELIYFEETTETGKAVNPITLASFGLLEKTITPKYLRERLGLDLVPYKDNLVADKLKIFRISKDIIELQFMGIDEKTFKKTRAIVVYKKF